MGAVALTPRATGFAPLRLEALLSLDTHVLNVLVKAFQGGPPAVRLLGRAR